jgi:acetyl-CoA carboxylase biotin carboxyl carrier protein
VIAAAPVAAAPAAALTPAPASDAPAAGSVSSPMVGTAYLSPEPNAAAFVKVGDRVAKGQTILIIEAMKVMNPIPAPHAGTVTQILVQDGQPVEFGEPLMVVA